MNTDEENPFEPLENDITDPSPTILLVNEVEEGDEDLDVDIV